MALRTLTPAADSNFLFRDDPLVILSRSYVMSEEILEHVYPGIGRLNYFLAHIAMIAVMVGAVLLLGPENPLFRVLSLAAMVAGVLLDVMRLRNIGVSQWFALLRFLPYVGGLVGIALQSMQTGWIESRRLDRAGWTIIGAYVGLFLLVMFLVFLRPQELQGLSLFSVQL